MCSIIVFYSSIRTDTLSAHGGGMGCRHTSLSAPTCGCHRLDLGLGRLALPFPLVGWRISHLQVLARRARHLGAACADRAYPKVSQRTICRIWDGCQSDRAWVRRRSSGPAAMLAGSGQVQRRRERARRAAWEWRRWVCATSALFCARKAGIQEAGVQRKKERKKGGAQRHLDFFRTASRGPGGLPRASGSLTRLRRRGRRVNTGKGPRCE